VTCLGSPFYAHWGLTDDRAMPIPRRAARVDLAALVHATLIAYPRYFDPITGLACPVEVIVDRLENGDVPAPGPMNRSLAKLQGLLASFAFVWR
jgi:capsular polysaccharide export protein